MNPLDDPALHSSRLDRTPTLPLHPGCRTCAWAAARWSNMHRLIGELATMRPARFARELPDERGPLMDAYEQTASTQTLRVEGDVRCIIAVRHPAYHLVQLHHVWPKGWGGPDSGETIPLCGLHHDDVHLLLTAMKRAGGPLPPDRRSYSPAVVRWALEGWRRAHGGEL